MKTRNVGIWTIAVFIMVALLISPLVLAEKKGKKVERSEIPRSGEDFLPRVIVTVDGLT